MKKYFIAIALACMAMITANADEKKVVVMTGPN